MANTTQREEIGEGIHVRDCYVSTEIAYLDSESGFRECLVQDEQLKAKGDHLVMLDSPAGPLRSAGGLRCGSPFVDALAGLAIIAIVILTISFFHTLVDF